MDFTELTKVAVGIINKLDHCQRGISSIDGRVSGFEREVKTAVADAEKSPAIDNSSSNTNTSSSSTATLQNTTTAAATTTSNNSVSKKAGVNYSLKDLTALRRRQSETGTQFTSRGDDDASTVDSRTLHTTNTTNSNNKNKSNTLTSTTALNTTSRLNNNKSSEGGDELPPGWVEKIDKASGRKYYVNQ